MNTTSMNPARGMIGTYAIIIGLFLLVEGIWGLFSPVVFGVLTTNMTHAIETLAAHAGA